MGPTRHTLYLIHHLSFPISAPEKSPQSRCTGESPHDRRTPRRPRRSRRRPARPRPPRRPTTRPAPTSTRHSPSPAAGAPRPRAVERQRTADRHGGERVPMAAAADRAPQPTEPPSTEATANRHSAPCAEEAVRRPTPASRAPCSTLLCSPSALAAPLPLLPSACRRPTTRCPLPLMKGSFQCRGEERGDGEDRAVLASVEGQAKARWLRGGAVRAFSVGTATR
jgi:hypothetical protein